MIGPHSGALSSAVQVGRIAPCADVCERRALHVEMDVEVALLVGLLVGLLVALLVALLVSHLRKSAPSPQTGSHQIALLRLQRLPQIEPSETVTPEEGSSEGLA